MRPHKKGWRVRFLGLLGFVRFLEKKGECGQNPLLCEVASSANAVSGSRASRCGAIACSRVLGWSPGDHGQY
jgi:hypothetical protein